MSSISNARRVIQELEREQVRPVLIASHPRCGTHLLIDTLRLNFASCQSWKRRGEQLDRLYLNLDSITRPKDPLLWASAGSILRRAVRPIIKTHALPDFQTFYLERVHRTLPDVAIDWVRRNATVLYVYRDVRSAMCSLHQFVGTYDPGARVPMGQFIRQMEGGVSRIKAWANHVRAWTDDPRVYCVKMEEILRMPALTVNGLAERLGEPRLPGQVRLPPRSETIWHSRLSRLFATRPLSTAILAGSGREKPADPRSAFTPADLRFIRDEVGDLLFRLGYENAEFWAGDDIELCEADYADEDAGGSPNNMFRQATVLGSMCVPLMG